MQVSFFLQLMADPIDYNKIAIIWRGMMFFFKALMFGLCNSGYNEQRVTTAVVYILKVDTMKMDNKTADVLNYSDDLAGVDGDKIRSWKIFYMMSALLQQLGLEKSIDEAEPPACVMTYFQFRSSPRTSKESQIITELHKQTDFPIQKFTKDKKRMIKWATNVKKANSSNT